MAGFAAAALRAAALMAYTAAAISGPANGSKPHIVMFVVDDLGWHNVGWHNPDMITPHSNRLLKQGVELDRSYVAMYCAPTRSSIMTGRLPYHVNQIILGNWHRDWNAPREMTAIPQKLKQAGYATHMVGKWHVGFQDEGQTPHGRGFDTSFGYFGGAEDHWTQACCIDPTCNKPSLASTNTLALRLAGWKGNCVDLWCTDRPCWGQNGSDYRMGRNGQVVGDDEHYGDNMYTKEALRLISAHNPRVPLFLYVAFQSNHEPLEAPDKYIELYPKEWREDRRWYAAMTTYWDECVGLITDRLVQKGMWNDTLIVLTTDNGGPTYWSPPFQRGHYRHGGGANNWPLRGSKVSNWEGGVRGASFASGGFLPERVRGRKLEEYLHVTDWYATFCYLAGVDPADPNTEGVRSDGTRFKLPGVDSLNMWPVLSGEVAASPRQEIPLTIHHPMFNNSALIVGDFKLLLGPQRFSYWQGPEFPNGTAPYGRWLPQVDCGNDITLEGGCLFNIRTDPAETVDLASSLPELLRSMKERYTELRQTALDQEHCLGRGGLLHPVPREFVSMLHANRGIVGPWLPAVDELIV